MDIDDEEFVETSDIEELADLQNVRRFTAKSPRRAAGHEADEDIPRKRIKFKHLPTQFMRMSVSPQKTTSTHVRSRSSSMTLEQSSPSPLFTMSRSPTVESQEVILPKAMSSEPHEEILLDDDGISQDPLLLCTPPRRIEVPETTISTTPPGSPAEPWLLSPADVVSLPAISPAKVDDAVMLFTPVKTPARLPSPFMSPISPGSPTYRTVQSPVNMSPATSSPSRMSPALPSRESSRSPTPAPPITAPQVQVQAPENRDHDLALALEQENARDGPYSLRPRRPAQIRPYSAEHIVYKISMRSNPEAIVHKRALDRRGHDSGHYEDEETQQDVYCEDDPDRNVPDEENEEWLQQQRRRMRREEKRRETGDAETRNRPLGSPQQRIIAALPGLPDDSDEEEQDKLAWEAATLERKRLRKEEPKRREEKEEKQRRRRLKRFPVIPKDPPVASIPSSTSDRRSETREPEVEERPQSPGPVHTDLDDLFSDVYLPPPIYIPSSPHRFHDANQPTPVEHDANHDMEWDADASEFGTHLMDTADDVPEDDRQPNNGLFEDGQVAADDEDQPLEETIDLPRSKLKYLQKCWPTSMIKKQAAKGDSRSAKRKKEQKRREQLAYDDGGELAPGQSRVKKSTRPKDVSEIKGDSESEVELDMDRPRSPSPPARQMQHVIFIPSESESEDEVEVLESYRRPFVPRIRPELEIGRDENSSAEDTFDEDDLEDYILAPESDGIDHLRDPSLIDYMLTRERPRNTTATRMSRIRRRPPASAACQPSGGRRPSASAAAAPPHRYSSSTPGPSMSSQSSSAMIVDRDAAEPSSSSSKYKFDVTSTGGRKLGHSKQTLLQFHVPKKPTPKPKPNHTAKASSSSRPSQAAPRRSHTRKQASARNVGYLLADGHDDAPSDSSLAPAQQYAPKHKKPPVSRPRATTEHDAGPSRPRLSKSTSSGSRPAASSSYAAEADNHEPHPNKVRDAEAEARRLERARKKRVRKERAKKIGVWCNQERGQVVTSGVMQTFVTVDVEDEYFHGSLVPASASKERVKHWSNHFRPSPPPPPRIRKRRHAASDAESEADVDDPHPQDPQTRVEEPLRHLPNDMNIPFLQPGKSFDESAYITKGWLHELVKVISASSEPVRPAALNTLGISLDPDMTVDQFCAAFSEVTEEAFSFATELPLLMDDDEPGMNEQEKGDVSQKQWLLLTQAVCRLISLYVRNAQQIEIDKLRDLVEKDILQLAKKIDEFQFKSTSSSVLIVTWFMVEALARVAQSPQNQSGLARTPKSLQTAVTLLMRLLLDVEMEETMKNLAENVGLCVKSTGGFAAELWVRLIHLFHPSPSDGSVVQSKHPFWLLFIEASKMRSSRLTPESKKSRPFNASEDAWGTIFMMCALSQFSLHGMIAGQPRLPACWDVVVCALSNIRLDTHGIEIDDDDRKRHDEYVALLVNRCLALRQKWHWSLRDSSAMFSALVNIFRSRQFANLLHESKVRLPDFMRLQKMDLVSSYNPEDTAYAVFLKLIVQATQEEPAHTREKPSPRIKKLLSLAVPLGSVTKYDETSKDGRQKCRSMFYNRLAAIAAAVDLDIHSYDERFSRAQGYVPSIGASHSKLQFDVIGGLTSWAQFLVYRSIKLDGLAQWFKLIASDLSKRKHLQGSDVAAVKENRTNLALTAALLSSVRRIYACHLELSIYPEPLLIQGLHPILNMWLVKHEDMSDHVKCFLEKLFEARFASLGKPQQPSASVAELGDEDSQDYWGAETDIPPEAFVGLVEPLKDKESSMRMFLDNSLFRHAISQHLGRSLKPPPSVEYQKSYEKECDTWIRLALSFYTVDFEMTRWKDGIQKVYSVIKLSSDGVNNESWTQRIHLSAIYHILLLHPMSYEAMNHDAARFLMLALVSAGEALENAYVALFLSCGGLHHPVLRNATFLPPVATSGNYEFSPAEFADIRLSLFKLILLNLNDMDVSLKTHRKRNGYEQFCRDVKASLDLNAQLVDDPKFDYWTKLWAP
ncbi:hypothetical protein D9619_006111 [Psilocybe cf. subviscida]|uniref:Protein mms22 n=1 Tax=Psilocybe cf. subviscida TaxID=2480587 RepID=A0A8H5EXL8_9AGAR|nr:hypothetical protein D9619_006111 [Psilocybe cf. subviscida]